MIVLDMKKQAIDLIRLLSWRKLAEPDLDDWKHIPGKENIIVRCGDLEKLIRCVAYVIHVVGRAHRHDHVVKVWTELDASEYNDAYN